MSENVNRQWQLQSSVDMRLSEEHFRWAESPVPSPGNGQVVVRNLWLSLDPTQLLQMLSVGEAPATPIGSVPTANALAQVVESRLPGYAPGDLVEGFFGWEDYTVTDGTGFLPMAKVPSGTPPHLALGVYGITGMVAYFGVLEVGRPRRGETFVVSGAAGGVGYVAGQIAKIRGLRVIGIAGGRSKCTWLTRDLGFDAAIDRHSEDVGARLTELCPDGIDIFFDNSGGPVLDLALSRLRQRGRVVLCGATAMYGAPNSSPGPSNYLSLVMVNGRMEGILARDYADRYAEARAALEGWIRSGQLITKEDVVVGLENAPRALARLFSGENVGKQLLKIADPSPVRGS